MSTSAYRVRVASAADAATIARHRVLMFRDMGQLGRGEDMAALETASRDYLAAALTDERYRGWLAEDDGDVVAGGGLVLRPLLPRPGYAAGGTEGYILNVYTEAAHRRRGLARLLMHAMLEWCADHAVARAALHASDEGRPLYDALGFVGTNEMCRPLR